MIQRLTQVQLLRGAAAFMVMASHLPTIEHKYAIDPVIPRWLEIGMSGVDLFFVISGFIMAVLVIDSRRGPVTAVGFLFGRAGRIYPLYWAVSAALTVVWFVKPDWVFSSDPTPPHWLTSFSLWPDTRIPLLAVGWTLVHEMYFYLVFTLLLLAPRALMAPGLIIWAIVVGVGVFRGAGAAGPEARIALHPLTFEFILGALCGLVFTRWRGFGGMAALVLGLAGFIGAAVYVARTGLVDDSAFWTDSLLRPALFAGPAALTVYGLACFDLRGHPAPKFFSALGDQSYALYLTHILSLSVAGRIWALLPQTRAPWDNIAAIAVLVAFAYVAAELTYRLVDLPAHNAARLLRRQLFGRAAPAGAPAQ